MTRNWLICFVVLGAACSQLLGEENFAAAASGSSTSSTPFAAAAQPCRIRFEEKISHDVDEREMSLYRCVLSDRTGKDVVTIPAAGSGIISGNDPKTGAFLYWTLEGFVKDLCERPDPAAPDAVYWSDLLDAQSYEELDAALGRYGVAAPLPFYDAIKRHCIRQPPSECVYKYYRNGDLKADIEKTQFLIGHVARAEAYRKVGTFIVNPPDDVEQYTVVKSDGIPYVKDLFEEYVEDGKCKVALLKRTSGAVVNNPPDNPTNPGASTNPDDPNDPDSPTPTVRRPKTYPWNSPDMQYICKCETRIQTNNVNAECKVLVDDKNTGLSFGLISNNSLGQTIINAYGIDSSAECVNQCKENIQRRIQMEEEDPKNPIFPHPFRSCWR